MSLLEFTRRLRERCRRDAVRLRRRLSPTERRLRPWVLRSEAVPGWTRGDEAWALARASYELPAGAVIVEAGAFLGSGTILLAGARVLRGDGTVHAIDPFDASGDAFSVPHYTRIAGGLARTLREQFEENIREAGVGAHVRAHVGTAESVAHAWRGPVDLVFLDGDQSPAGARAAFEAWLPHLQRGGVMALHNSGEREYAAGHDGYRRLALTELRGAGFSEVRVAGGTTFARKR